jgi:hypothetical protein
LPDASTYQPEIRQESSVVWQRKRMLQVARALVLLGAGVSGACGTVKGETPDASPPDAELPMSVKATVLTFAADGLPDATAKIVFLNPEGEVVLDGPVDASGRAEALLSTGGTVMAIRITNDTPTSLIASVDVTIGAKAGDDLTFGLKAPGTILNQGGQTMMTASFTPLTNATSYSFFTSCGASSTTTSPVTLNFRDSCRSAMFDLIGVASGAMLTTPAVVRLVNVSYLGGGSFAIPVGFTSMSSFTINLTNLPAEISTLGGQRASMIGNVPVATQFVGAGDPPAGAFALTVPYASGFGTRSEVGVTLRRADAESSQRHDMHTATLASSVGIDIGAQALPWFADVVQTTTGGTWTMVAPGGAPDGMMTQWTGRWVDGQRTVTVTWRVSQPADMSGMTLPALPPAYSMLDPSKQTVPISPLSMVVIMADYDNLTGYDELRQMSQTLLIPSIGSMGAFVGMPFQRRLSTMTGR